MTRGSVQRNHLDCRYVRCTANPLNILMVSCRVLPIVYSDTEAAMEKPETDLADAPICFVTAVSVASHAATSTTCAVPHEAAPKLNVKTKFAG